LDFSPLDSANASEIASTRVNTRSVVHFMQHLLGSDDGNAVS
jgi:hypothetical protein